MSRLLNFSFNGDIHWFFLLQTSKSAIHKGHDLAYYVKQTTYELCFGKHILNILNHVIFPAKIQI
jgi:hypothetical protein